MLFVMTASARKRFSATRSTTVKNMLNSSASLPETLPHVELIRALSIIPPHACSHAVVDLADDGEYSRWHAKASKDIPQKGSVDGVVCFGEVDKAQVRAGVLLPRQFLQSSYYEHHFGRRGLWSEPTLFFRPNVLAFANVPHASRDDFEEYLAGVSHEGDAMIIVTRSSIFLLVKHLNRCIFLLLRYATPPPHSDDDIVERLEYVQFSFVNKNLHNLGRETIGPYRLYVRQSTDRLLYFVCRQDIVQWSALGPLLKLMRNARVKGHRHGVEEFVKPPHPLLADEGIIPQQSTFLVFDVLRVKRPLPFHIHPFEVFVEAKLMTFSDTPFELTNVIFEEPLNSFRPRAFHLFGGRLQGSNTALSMTSFRSERRRSRYPLIGILNYPLCFRWLCFFFVVALGLSSCRWKNRSCGRHYVLGSITGVLYGKIRGKIRVKVRGKIRVTEEQ